MYIILGVSLVGKFVAHSVECFDIVGSSCSFYFLTDVIQMGIIEKIGTSGTKWGNYCIFGCAVKTGQGEQAGKDIGRRKKDDCIRFIPFFQLIPSFENDVIPFGW